MDACKLVAEHVAQKADKRFMLNLSAEFVTTFHKHLLLEIMPYVDILFGNDTEFLSFAKEMDFGTDFPTIAKSVAGMKKINDDRKRIVVITCGANPVVIAIGGDQVIQVPVEAMNHEDIVDTNGAGDAFVEDSWLRWLEAKLWNSVYWLDPKLQPWLLNVWAAHSPKKSKF